MEGNPPTIEVRLFENRPIMAYGPGPHREVRMNFTLPYNRGSGTLPLGGVTANPAKLAENVDATIDEMFNPESVPIVVRNGSGYTIRVSPGEYIYPPSDCLLDTGLYSAIVSHLKMRPGISLNETP